MTADLTALGRKRTNAQRALKKATDELRAAVLQALADGMSELQASHEAGVDRMTVRDWAGKRKRTRS